jgi:hypothetical protein
MSSIISCPLSRLVHLNQLTEQWLRKETDRRLHRTVKEVVVIAAHKKRNIIVCRHRSSDPGSSPIDLISRYNSR